MLEMGIICRGGETGTGQRMERRRNISFSTYIKNIQNFAKSRKMVFNFQHTVSSVSFHKMPMLFEGTWRVMCPDTVLFPCLGSLTVLLQLSFPSYSMGTLQLSVIKELSEGPTARRWQNPHWKPDVTNSNTYCIFGCSGLLSRTAAS